MALVVRNLTGHEYTLLSANQRPGEGDASTFSDCRHPLNVDSNSWIT